MNFLRSPVIPTLLLIALVLGCTVHSRYKTRTFMTDEEREEIERVYSGPSDDENGDEEATEIEIEPFMRGYHGPAIRVNDLEIEADDIRDLYEYLASFKDQEADTTKREACMNWIQAYAVMSQWPETIDTARTRIEGIQQQVLDGADFRYLIVENSQEPGSEETAGDLGTFGRGGVPTILEMRSFTEPLNRPSEPFPTTYGWHIVEVLERNTDETDDPTVHARHLLLFHGLDPENSEEIKANSFRWMNLADVELLVEELSEILPNYPMATEF